MPELKYEHVYVPFATQIPGGLGVGRKIKIKAKTDYTREPRFCINLGVAPAFHENIALHISPRQHEKTIVITHLNQGYWGAEQVYHNPIHHNKDHFELEIHVEPEYYKIELRHHHLASVPFVFPPHAVNHLEIEGGVIVEHIHIEGHSAGGQVVYEGMAPAPVYVNAQPTVVVERPQVMYAPPPVIVETRGPMIMPMMMRPAPIIVERRGPVIIDRHGPVIVGRHHGPVIYGGHHRRW